MLGGKRSYGLGLLAIILLGMWVVWHLSQQDKDFPVIIDLEYREGIYKNDYQKFTLYVNEKNPLSSALLKLNNTSIDLPMVKDYGNGTVVYERSSLSFQAMKENLLEILLLQITWK